MTDSASLRALAIAMGKRPKHANALTLNTTWAWWQPDKDDSQRWEIFEWTLRRANVETYYNSGKYWVMLSWGSRGFIRQGHEVFIEAFLAAVCQLDVVKEALGAEGMVQKSMVKDGE